MLPAIVPTGAVAAAAGTWGPDRIAYLNGVVCSGNSGRTALVSWPDDSGAPAFGVTPIAARRGAGVVDEPAVSGVAVPVAASATGLSASAIAQLAFLIDRHGADPAGGVVADVAADVLEQVGSSTIDVDDCLAQNVGGSSQRVTAQLATEAERLAGPYTVSLTGPDHSARAGTPLALTAQVLSADGVAVPNMVVTLTPSAGVTLSAGSVVTNAAGRAAVQASTATAGPSATATPTVTASVSAVTGLVESTEPGRVALIAAAPAKTYLDRLALNVSLPPDPTLTLDAAQSVVLAGDTPQDTLAVAGMNGHTGTAAVSLVGPLTLTSHGCSGYTTAQWAQARAAGKTVGSTQVAVTADADYPVTFTNALGAGCYQPFAKLVTTDATPNVSATTTGAALAAVSVAVAATPPHDGLAPVGALTTALTATGTYPASWQDVRAQVLGPRPAVSGRCPTSGWGSTPIITTGTTANDTSADSSANSSADQADSASTSTPGPSAPATGSGSASRSASGSASGSASASATDPAAASSAGSGSAASTVATARVSSGAVQTAGCYAFRLTGTLDLPGIGSTSVSVLPGSSSAPVHVITPSVEVTGLSGSGVPSGGRLSASVTVSASDGQPGALQLQLLRMPYTWRGCFEADWSAADVTDTVQAAPVKATNGDSTYTVQTAAVPGPACWTVVPVFTASANPAVRATTKPGADPMLAFTSVARPPAAADAASRTTAPGGLLDPLTAVLATVAIFAITMLGTALAARRGRRHEVITAADRLLN